MAIPKQAPERVARYKALVKLEQYVTGLEIHELDQAELAENNIQFLPMSLDDDATLKPHFFEPYPEERLCDPEEVKGEKFSSPDEIHLAQDIFIPSPKDHAYNIQMYLRSYNYHIKLNDDEYLLPWSSIYPADWPFPRKPLDQDTEPRWGSYNLNHVLGEEHPHFICRMYNDMVAHDHQLLRGELLTILRIMVGQHIWARLLKHMVVPVLLVSLVGPKCARVIESYFDGQQLVVRCSKLIDFSFHNVAGFKTLAKWYMSRPIGDTTMS